MQHDFANGKQRSKRPGPIIDGRKMRCPRCKSWYDLLTFVPLMMIKEYENQTATIYKCKCNWLFAPIPELLEDFFD